jgi:hypothetical protein
MQSFPGCSVHSTPTRQCGPDPLLSLHASSSFHHLALMDLLRNHLFWGELLAFLTTKLRAGSVLLKTPVHFYSCMVHTWLAIPYWTISSLRVGIMP